MIQISRPPVSFHPAEPAVTFPPHGPATARQHMPILSLNRGYDQENEVPLAVLMERTTRWC